MNVPSGMNSTSLSKALWELVKDFFWDKSGTTFAEWLRTFSSDGDDWHSFSPGDGSISHKCLYDGGTKSEVSSCLHVAASYGLSDILEWAHPEGLNFDIKSRKGKSPLMYAAHVGKIDAVKVILCKGGINVNLTLCGRSDCNDRHKYVVGTALEYAILSRSSEMMELLLKQPGIEVDYVWHGTTALGVAINYGFLKEIRLLVGAGAKLAMWQGGPLTIPSSS
jgi:ankyrin repeat protein